MRCSLQEAVNKYGETAAKVGLLLSLEPLCCNHVPVLNAQAKLFRRGMQTHVQGEITLLIEGALPSDDTITSDELRLQLVSLIASGQSTSSAAKIASKQLGVARREAYAVALEIQAIDAI